MVSQLGGIRASVEIMALAHILEAASTDLGVTVILCAGWEMRDMLMASFRPGDGTGSGSCFDIANQIFWKALQSAPAGLGEADEHTIFPS